jgi:hypothetical protein
MGFMRCEMYATGPSIGQSRFEEEEAIHKRAVQIHHVDDMTPLDFAEMKEMALRM